MNKKLPLYLQSCHHFFKVNLKKNLLAFFSVLFISLSAFSQGPGCPNVYAGEDVELGCGEPCTDLTASFLDTVKLPVMKFLQLHMTLLSRLRGELLFQ